MESAVRRLRTKSKPRRSGATVRGGGNCATIGSERENAADCLVTVPITAAPTSRVSRVVLVRQIRLHCRRVYAACAAAYFLDVRSRQHYFQVSYLDDAYHEFLLHVCGKSGQQCVRSEHGGAVKFTHRDKLGPPRRCPPSPRYQRAPPTIAPVEPPMVAPFVAAPVRGSYSSP